MLKRISIPSRLHLQEHHSQMIAMMKHENCHSILKFNHFEETLAMLLGSFGLQNLKHGRA